MVSSATLLLSHCGKAQPGHGIHSEAVHRHEATSDDKAPFVYPANHFYGRAILSETFANLARFLIPMQQDQRYPATTGSRAFLGGNAQVAICGQARRAGAVGPRSSSM